MAASSDSVTLYCTFHPERETLLRCNRCNRPMCTECLILVPTGYRCKACVADLQRAFEKAGWGKALLLGLVAALLAALGGWILPALGLWLIFLTPLWAYLVSEVLLRLKPGPGRRPYWTITLGLGIGSLFPFLVEVEGWLVAFFVGLTALFNPEVEFPGLAILIQVVYRALVQLVYVVLLWVVVRRRLYSL